MVKPMMNATYYKTLRNQSGKYPTKFAYKIEGDVLPLLEFEFQRSAFCRRDEKNHLIYIFPWFLGNEAEISLNTFNHKYFIDGNVLSLQENLFSQRGEDFWRELYKQTGDVKWLINRTDYIPEAVLGTVKGRVPKKLKSSLKKMNWN